MNREMRALAAASLALAVLACQLVPAASGGDRPTPRAARSLLPQPTQPSPGGAIEANGGGILSQNGGRMRLPDRSELPAGITTRVTSPLTGRVSLPAPLLGDRGGGLVWDQGGALVGNHGGGLIGDRGAGLSGAMRLRTLLQAPRADAPGVLPVASATVVVVDAAGRWVSDLGGRPFTATTDAQGAYTFAQAPAGVNLLLQVLDLPAAAGTPTAFLPAVKATSGQVARSVDVDAVSTLTMGYIATKFVKGAQAVLDRLPGDVEADTRRKLAQATGSDEALTSLAPEAVVERVDSLRARNADLDAQVRFVESLLVAGLSNMGDGMLATDVPLTAPHRLAVMPDGQLFVAETWASRIRRIDTAGRIWDVAGGLPSSNSLSNAGQIDVGDGRAATAASFSSPRTLAIDAAGNLFVSDWGNNRIRRIDAKTGTINSVAGGRPIEGSTRSFATPLPGTPPAPGTKANAADLTAPDGIAVDTQGRCVFAVREGTFRIEPDGTLTPLLHDGKVRGAPLNLASSSDGQVYAYYAGGFGRLTGDAFVPAADIPPRTFKDPWHLAAAPGGVLYMHGDGGLHQFKDGAWRQLLTFTEPKHPSGLAATADHVWVSSHVEGGVWRLTPATGAFTRVGGRKFDPAEGLRGDELGLSRPMAVAVDASNRLLVADGLRSLLWRRDTDGMYRLVAGNGTPPDNVDLKASGPALDLTIGLVTGLIPQANGAVIFSGGNTTGWGLFQVDTQGRLAPVSLPAGLQPLQAVKDAAGAWIVSDSSLGAVPESRLVRVVEGRVDELVPRRALTVHFGLLPRPDGTLYWVDVLGGTVHRRSPQGAITRVAGNPAEPPGYSGDGGLATAAQLNWPMALAMDATGHLYVADSQNHRIRRIDAKTGVITTLAGVGGAFFSDTGVDTGLRDPGGLAFDAEGNLFIADSGNNQIKRIPADQLPR